METSHLRHRRNAVGDALEAVEANQCQGCLDISFVSHSRIQPGNGLHCHDATTVARRVVPCPVVQLSVRPSGVSVARRPRFVDVRA